MQDRVKRMEDLADGNESCEMLASGYDVAVEYISSH